MNSNVDNDFSIGDEGLRGHLLIATPSLDRGIFKSSVTYICEHNEDGAMGVIINRPSSLTFGEVLDEFQTAEANELDSSPILLGGPVGMQRGFVLHQGRNHEWESSMPINSEIYLTGSKDILRALAKKEGPEDYLLTLGYAGWSSGQLEQEIIENSWLTVPANSQILFDVPYEKRFAFALEMLGVTEASLASTGGRA